MLLLFLRYKNGENYAPIQTRVGLIPVLFFNVYLQYLPIFTLVERISLMMLKISKAPPEPTGPYSFFLLIFQKESHPPKRSPVLTARPLEFQP
jgi:hypothetical protein